MDGKPQYPRLRPRKSRRRPNASADRSCFRCVQYPSGSVSVPVLITLGLRFLHEKGIVHGDLCGVSRCHVARSLLSSAAYIEKRLD